MRKGWCVTIGALTAVLLSLPLGAQCSADKFLPEVLFALDYGQGDSQVRVLPGVRDASFAAGPTGIGVAPDGSIWIADDLNRCAKRFSRDGELLAVTQPPEDLSDRLPRDPELWHAVGEGLFNLQHIAVDSEANVYTQSGTGMDLLSKFGPDGQWLWGLFPITVIPRELRGPISGFGLQGIGPGDTVCLELRGEREQLAVLSPAGEFIAVRDGYAITPSGRTIVVQPSAADWFTRVVTVEDPQGSVLASYVADSRAGFPELFRGANYGFSWGFFDGQDCMYTVAHADRDRVDLARGLSITIDAIVTRHDETGQPVAYLRLPSDPFTTGVDLTVDRDGNVYHLLFGGSSMDVVRYTLQKSTEIGRREAIQELPTITQGNTRYVPLRLVSEYVGRKVKWDNRTGKATVFGPSEGSGEHLALTPGEPGVIMHLGRVWVSTEVSHERLGVPLRLDAKQRIAYYESYAPEKLAQATQERVRLAQAAVAH